MMELMDHVGIHSQDIKYRKSMPSFGGFIYYILPLCGDMMV
ncbi:hypothetical protein HanXRQr2_Chr09g0378311 [Helianthus annuus]|uniref:Uncharacterized protein n=1 Tax=Helianthus annuus TaxID=4232 RepID=A0A9K3I4W5_HELAN|nr:hypothetical protein HanXRQr2_Chr09g0378311 [Helianthus annuus]KAJ0892348.1 hypothetical protein HanPSC8_Chr09g0364791 [Helianthus annuus]